MNMGQDRILAFPARISVTRRRPSPVARRPSRRALRMRLNPALVICDILCILIGFAIAAWLYPLASARGNAFGLTLVSVGKSAKEI